MTNRVPSRFVLVSRALARRAAILPLLCAAAGGLGGCGDSGSSASADPFDEYEGVWAIDSDDSAIDCPTEVDLRNRPFSIWGSEFTIAAGVLTDIVEVQGQCPLNYDVNRDKHVATLPNPDPYTNAAPTCKLTIDSSTGENIVLSPATGADSPWTFQLLQPTAGKAPPAQILGSADVVLTLQDSTTGILQNINCKFAPHVDAHKIAKP